MRAPIWPPFPVPRSQFFRRICPRPSGILMTKTLTGFSRQPLEVRRRGRLPAGLDANSSKAAAGSNEPILKRSPPTEGSSRRRQGQIAPPTLTRGQINAVRAAFKAAAAGHRTLNREARWHALTAHAVTQSRRCEAPASACLIVAQVFASAWGFSFQRLLAGFSMREPRGLLTIH
jgi:hypothetical protein